MGEIEDLVAFADPDHGPDVVRDDPEVVPMIRQIGGQKRGVAPGHDLLLAPIRPLPIHFDQQLVGFDDPRSRPDPRRHFRQERHDPMRPRRVGNEGRIGDGLGARPGGPIGEGHGVRMIPGLGGRVRTRHQEQKGTPPKAHRRGNIAIALMVTALVAGCGGPPRVSPRPTTGPVLPPPPDPSRLDQVFVLESGGPSAEDTAVAVPRGRRRLIVLRRGAPDNSLFATVSLPDTTAVSGDSIRVSVRPRPGIYGVDVSAEGGSLAGTTISLSYAVHFVAPAGARARYGGDLGFERALFIARVESDGRVIFLPTARPGSDLLSAVVPGPGRYLVAAPR